VGENVIGIFGPGGDPAAIRRAAAACRTLASDLDPISGDLERIAHPLAAAGLSGFPGGSTGTAAGEFWLQGEPFTDRQAWATVAENGAISGVTGAAIGASAQGISRLPGLLRSGAPPDSQWSERPIERFEEPLAPRLSTLAGPSGRPLNLATGTEQPPEPVTLLGPSGQAPGTASRMLAHPGPGKWRVPRVTPGDMVRGFTGVLSGMITYKLTFSGAPPTPTGPPPPARTRWHRTRGAALAATRCPPRGPAVHHLPLHRAAGRQPAGHRPREPGAGPRGRAGKPAHRPRRYPARPGAAHPGGARREDRVKPGWMTCQEERKR